MCMQKLINTYYRNTIMPKAERAKRTTTSIKGYPELWKEVKKLCIDKNMDVSDWLEEIIRRELRKK